MTNFILYGQLADVWQRSIYPAAITIEEGKIADITPLAELPEGTPDRYILPGFIDSHVHIESSMLVPSEFARMAVVHGTVATVSDPHEIANVCGLKGVEYMINNGKTVPFKFFFGAPSCVPATIFETAGATLDAAQVEALLQKEEILYLSEMMNFPGVLNKDPEVMQKIQAAHRLGKPVDGHAPALRGEQAKQYIQVGLPAVRVPPEALAEAQASAKVGISTDHECFTKEEALDKLQYGMKIIIREGSAARNFEALIELLHDYPDKILFCSDDKHPDSLEAGHINQLCARAVAKGIDRFHVLQAACVNPVLHYKLPVGLLRAGDPADCIIVNDLNHFQVQETYINGQLVAKDGQSLISTTPAETINNFNCSPKEVNDFTFPWNGKPTIQVIEALDGQLITNCVSMMPTIVNGAMISDPEKDLIKIVVVNRYRNAPIAKAFITNTGLKKGALASSVAHDSHNIVAIGADDESLCRAVNLVIEQQGGISCVGETEEVLPLPVAGLMSREDGYKVAAAYTAIDQRSRSLGILLSAPFMTLSFMALLVIPHLKLSDQGLFDGDSFSFV